MMEPSPYQDRFSRYHDKPCVSGEPSSNNGWLYTAYAQKLGLPVDRALLRECFDLCLISSFPLKLYRSPGKENPPMSRDEILGMYFLIPGFLDLLLANNWSFSPYPIPPFNLLKTLGALWRMRKAHRNVLWQNGGEPHLFRFAFSVPIQDRAFMLEHSRRVVPIGYKIFERVSKIVSLSTKSSRMIEWLKFEKEVDTELLKKYFGEQHEFLTRFTFGAGGKLTSTP